MRGHFAVGVQSREEGGEGREKCVDGALERACKVGRREEGAIPAFPSFALAWARKMRGSLESI